MLMLNVTGVQRYVPLGGEELLLLDHSNLTTTQTYLQFRDSDAGSVWRCGIMKNFAPRVDTYLTPPYMAGLDARSIGQRHRSD